jgi:plastocyanin
MKSSLLAIAAVGAVTAGVAGLSGAFSAGHAGAGAGGAHPASVVDSHMPAHMTMAMPAASTSSSGSLHLALHQRVVHLTIMNDAFQPARIEVSPGARVVWTNQDSDPHTVATDRPGFASQALGTGQAYARVLTKTGTFAYHCTIHPFMHGTVIVAGKPV